MKLTVVLANHCVCIALLHCGVGLNIHVSLCVLYYTVVLV